jgi:hypothetical protein
MNNDLMSTLKWKELAEVEAYLDMPMDEWQDSPSKAKLAFAMQYIMAKRNNPGLTIEDAEAMTIEQLSEASGVTMQVPKEGTSA